MIRFLLFEKLTKIYNWGEPKQINPRNFTNHLTINRNEVFQLKNG